MVRLRKDRGKAEPPAKRPRKPRQRPGIEVPIDGGEAMQRMVVLGTGLFRVKRAELPPAKPPVASKPGRGKKTP